MDNNINPVTIYNENSSKNQKKKRKKIKGDQKIQSGDGNRFQQQNQHEIINKWNQIQDGQNIASLNKTQKEKICQLLELFGHIFDEQIIENIYFELECDFDRTMEKISELTEDQEGNCQENSENYPNNLDAAFYQLTEEQQIEMAIKKSQENEKKPYKLPPVQDDEEVQIRKALEESLNLSKEQEDPKKKNQEKEKQQIQQVLEESKEESKEQEAPKKKSQQKEKKQDEWQPPVQDDEQEQQPHVQDDEEEQIRQALEESLKLFQQQEAPKKKNQEKEKNQIRQSLEESKEESKEQECPKKKSQEKEHKQDKQPPVQDDEEEQIRLALDESFKLSKEQEALKKKNQKKEKKLIRQALQESKEQEAPKKKIQEKEKQQDEQSPVRDDEEEQIRLALEQVRQALQESKEQKTTKKKRQEKEKKQDKKPPVRDDKDDSIRLALEESLKQSKNKNYKKEKKQIKQALDESLKLSQEQEAPKKNSQKIEKKQDQQLPVQDNGEEQIMQALEESLKLSQEQEAPKIEKEKQFSLAIESSIQEKQLQQAIQSSLQTQEQIEQDLYEKDEGFQVMCEMFIREDDLITRHQIYEIYTTHYQEECFLQLSNFYLEIEDLKIIQLVQIDEPEVIEMQPQEVLFLFQCYKEQLDWDLQKNKQRVEEKQEANKTFQDFLNHLAETEFERISLMNKTYLLKPQTEEEKEQFHQLIRAQIEIKNNKKYVNSEILNLNCSNKQHQKALESIFVQAKIVSANLIQNAYDIIQIPSLIWELIDLCFEIKQEDSDDQKQYEKKFKKSRKKKQYSCELSKANQVDTIKLPKANQADNLPKANQADNLPIANQADNFWSPRLVRDFMWKYYKKRESQLAYDEFKAQPLQQLNKDIEAVKQKIFHAQCNKNYELKNEMLCKLLDLKKKKTQMYDSSELQIFSFWNDDETQYHLFIDLHGQSAANVTSLVTMRLLDVTQMFYKGKFEPNIDSSNHVFKIICGAGNHSKGQAVLKDLVKEILTNQGYDFYTDNEYYRHGIYLVKFFN